MHKFQLFPSTHNSAVLPLCEQELPGAASEERSQWSRSLLNISNPDTQQDSGKISASTFYPSADSASTPTLLHHG